jgi:hypothetical protein
MGPRSDDQSDYLRTGCCVLKATWHCMCELHFYPNATFLLPFMATIGENPSTNGRPQEIEWPFVPFICYASQVDMAMRLARPYFMRSHKIHWEIHPCDFFRWIGESDRFKNFEQRILIFTNIFHFSRPEALVSNELNWVYEQSSWMLVLAHWESRSIEKLGHFCKKYWEGTPEMPLPRTRRMIG